MTAETSNWQALTERVEKLERQNRRLKQAGAVALIISAAVLLMGQASPNRTVEANEFILKDEGGTVRGRLHMGADGPLLALLDANGQVRAQLRGWNRIPGLSLLHPNGQAGVSLDLSCLRSTTDLCFSSSLRLRIRDGRAISLFNSEPFGSVLDFSDKKEVTRVSLSSGAGGILDGVALKLRHPKGGEEALEVDANGPFLRLFDEEGFQTTIGTTDLLTPRTGETHKTSAASVVLFDKDNKVLWKAP